MAATVFGAAQYGAADDSSATGLHIASLTYTFGTEQARGNDHEGFNVALAIYNDTTEVSCSGVIKTKGTGLVPALADTVTLANESLNSLSLNDDAMFSTPDVAAGTVVIGATVERSNTDFETGSLQLLYLPLVALS